MTCASLAKTLSAQSRRRRNETPETPGCCAGLKKGEFVCLLSPRGGSSYLQIFIEVPSRPAEAVHRVRSEMRKAAHGLECVRSGCFSMFVVDWFTVTENFFQSTLRHATGRQPFVQIV